MSDAAPALPRAARRLSLVVLGLSVGTALPGVLGRAHERREPAVRELLRADDAVALVDAAVLTGSLLVAGTRARVLWAASMAFHVYDAPWALYRRRDSDGWPAKAALGAAAALALPAGLPRRDVPRLAAAFGSRTPARPVAALLLALGGGLGSMWVTRLARGRVRHELTEPSALVSPPGLTRWGAVLDLSLLVPAYVSTGLLLWRRRAWGLVLAPALLSAGVLHQLSYVLALRGQARAGIAGATGSDPVEPVIAGAYAVGAGLLLRACRTPSRTAGQTRRLPAWPGS